MHHAAVGITVEDMVTHLLASPEAWAGYNAGHSVGTAYIVVLHVLNEYENRP